MNDFQQALKKWDGMSQRYQQRIDAQTKTINSLLTQNLFLEGTLAGLAAGTPDDAVVDIKTFAQNTLDKLDEMRQGNG